MITPRTNAYKDFEIELKNNAAEIFFRDGERKFSDKEKKFMQIYKSKEHKMIVGAAFTVNTMFSTASDTPVITNFKNLAELLPFIERQKISTSVLTIKNNTTLSEVTIDSEAFKQKFISDSWAKELENRTDLSIGLSNIQIDERQRHYYRIYEMEMKKELAEELSNYYYMKREPIWDFSTEHGLKVLDLALEISNFPEELRTAVIYYSSLKAPYHPEAIYFKYGLGDGDYEKAMERYEASDAKYSDELKYYRGVLSKYNFDSHRIDNLRFSEDEHEMLINLVEDLREHRELSVKKEFLKELNSYYDRNDEPMWNFSTEHGLKVLDLALEMKDLPEELEKAIIGWISLQAPYFPERYDFVDDSYDRGESDYEKAVERYEVNAAKFSDQLQYYHNIFFKYNFDNDRVDALNFSQYEAERLITLVRL